MIKFVLKPGEVLWKSDHKLARSDRLMLEKKIQEIHMILGKICKDKEKQHNFGFLLSNDDNKKLNFELIGLGHEHTSHLEVSKNTWDISNLKDLPKNVEVYFLNMFLERTATVLKEKNRERFV